MKNISVRSIQSVGFGYFFKKAFIRFICYVFLIVLAIVCIIPVWMLLINATRHSEEITRSLSLLPGTHLLYNYGNLVDAGINIVRGTFNSLFIALSSTALSIYFSLLTAYAFSAYNVKGKKYLFAFILAMTMVPGNLFIIGYFQYMHRLGLLDNYIPLIVPAIASAGTVFFFKQYFDSSLSMELIQAARVDGAGELKIFNKLILPIAKPGAFTMAIFGFVGSWNNFMVPFFLLSPSRLDLHPLPLLMRRLNANIFRVDMGLFYLGMAMSIIPILIVYFLFSKHIVTGISIGAVKE